MIEAAIESKIEKNRLLWRCRQGTRELELLLYRFIENHYGSLSQQDKLALHELIEHNVDQLNQWLLIGKQCEHNKFTNIINAIRNSH